MQTFHQETRLLEEGDVTLNAGNSMHFLARRPVGQSVLVGLGFAFWFGISNWVPVSWDWFFVVTYLAGGSGFFVVGCFLPEHVDLRFFSRRSALRLMAFFFWLSASAIGRIPMVQHLSWSWLADFSVFGSILIALGSYFVAFYLIRDSGHHPNGSTMTDNRTNNRVPMPVWETKHRLNWKFHQCHDQVLSSQS